MVSTKLKITLTALMVLLSLSLTVLVTSGASETDLAPIQAGSEVLDTWNQYKADYITSNRAGPAPRMRVMGGVSPNSTVSEGQAYGILASAVFNEQALLDGLWLFTADHLNQNGLMHWHIGNYGELWGTGAATDAEFDMAMGLIYACEKVRAGDWPASANGLDYCQIATNMINAMWAHEIDHPGAGPSAGLNNNPAPGLQIIPGDSWNLSAEYPEGITNLSYFSPAYMRVFAEFTGNSGWYDAVTQNYAIAEATQTRITGNCSGLVPNWSQYDADAQVVPWQGETSRLWSYDAARFAWRIAMDRYWFNSTESRTNMNRIGGFFSSIGINNVKADYRLDGSIAGNYSNPFFTANAAAAIWAAPDPIATNCGHASGSLQSNGQQAYNRLASMSRENYYNDSWRLLSMMLMAGYLQNPYSDGTPPPLPSPSPSPDPTDEPTPDPTEPPPPPADTDLLVSLQLLDMDQRQAQFQTLLRNNSASPISGISLRLYYTPDNGRQALEFVLANYYDQSGGLSISGPDDAGDGHFVYTLAYDATLQPDQVWAFNGALHLSDWSNNFDGSNDWFLTAASENGLAPTSFVPAYVNDVLLAGDEPNAADPTETPAPNTPPTAVDDAATTAYETMIVVDAAANDSDADGDALTIVNVDTPANGSVNVDSNFVLYTPNAGFSGTDSFSYTISDGADTASATITVTVEAAPDPVNTAPTAVDDAATTAYETAIVINPLTNDSDADGDTLSLVSIGTPTNGTAIQNGNALLYTPNAGFSGVDSFSYTVSDGADSASATITVTVEAAPANGDPTMEPIADQTNTVGESISLQVLGEDPDGSLLRYNATGLPDGLSMDAQTGLIAGTLTTAQVTEVTIRAVAGDGDEVSRSFTWTVEGDDGQPPAPDSDLVIALKVGNLNNQQASVEYRLRNEGDSPATGLSVRLYFTPDNERPASDYVLKNYWEQTGDLTITGPTQAADGHAYYTLSYGDAQLGAGQTWGFSGAIHTRDWSPNFVGSNDWFLTVFDGSSFARTDYLPIYSNGVRVAGLEPTGDGTPPPPTNTPPNAVPDSATTGQGQAVTIQPLANDSDPDGDPLTLVSVTTPANGSAAQQGNSIVYTPNAGFSGVDTFGYTVSDGADTRNATISVTVTAPEDQRPIIDPISDQSSTVGDSVSLQVVARDPQGDTLSYFGVFPPGLSIDRNTGVIDGVPTAAGSYRSTVRVMDSARNDRVAVFQWVIADAPDPTEPPPPAGGDFEVAIQTQTVSAQQAQFNLRLHNTGDSAATGVSLRLYFMPDNGRAASDYVLDRHWDQSNAATVNGPLDAGGGQFYFEINYGDAQLGAGQTWQFNGAVHLNNWREDFDASNDHWLSVQGAAFQPTTTIPVYVNGALVAGTQP